MRVEGLEGLYISTLGQNIRKLVELQKNFEISVEAGLHEFFIPFIVMLLHSAFSLVCLISLGIEEE